MRNIIYIGDLRRGRTSWHRMLALKNLGHRIIPIDQASDINNLFERVLRSFRQRVGYPLDPNNVNILLLKSILDFSPDLIWLDKPMNIKRSTLVNIKEIDSNLKIVAYSPDDMLNPQNQSKYHTKILPLLDAYYTTKSFGVNELKNMGCKNVFFIENGYCTEIHRPVIPSFNSIRNKVGFIGGYEYERYQNILFLANNGINVNIQGSFWNKVGSENLIKIKNGDLIDLDYSAMISLTDINLCFLRKANRDLQTSRSIEIPACGGFMLAERSDEHLQLFKDGIEAVFFSDKQEMLDKTKYYLNHPEQRLKIAMAGRDRCKSSGYSNESRMSNALKLLDSI